MKRQTTIKVVKMRLGMTICEGRRRIPIKKLSPCTQRNKVHVNDKMCYDYVGYVTVEDDEKPEEKTAQITDVNRHVLGERQAA